MQVDAAADTLQRVFGHATFRAGQRRVVDLALRGESSLAVFPTGGGKSVCFQLPAVLLHGLTVVISPLISLQKDQVDYLKSKGICAEAWNSSMSSDDLNTMKSNIRAGKLKLLYIAPEKLNNSACRELLKNTVISMFVVDESHCVSSWGHSFRPDFLKVASFVREELECSRVMALTATATLEVARDICREFSIPEANCVRLPFFRPNLHIHVEPVTDATHELKLKEIVRVHRETEQGPIIVYVTVQKACERLATMLSKAGFPAESYHAGMLAEKRKTIQDWFASDASGPKIVVATIAFGMGIDVSNISLIVHYNMSKSVESYGQEIGRAGRNGCLAKCITLYNEDDLSLLEAFAFTPTPDKESVRFLLKTVFEGKSVGDIVNIVPSELTVLLDATNTTLDMLMAYLDIDFHAVREKTPAFREIKWPMDRDNRLVNAAKIDPVARWVSAHADRKSKWVYLRNCDALPSADEGRILPPGEVTREQVVGCLFQLQLNNSSSGMFSRFQILSIPDNLDAVADGLYLKMVDREKKDLQRLELLRSLLTGKSCYWKGLCQHFGDHIDECKTSCQVCISGPPTNFAVAHRDSAAVKASFDARAAKVQPGAIPFPRKPELSRMLAKFLVGHTSPGMKAQSNMAVKALKAHDLFGVLEGHDFVRVLELCEEIMRGKRAK